jgi:hypothetical protein
MSDEAMFEYVLAELTQTIGSQSLLLNALLLLVKRTMPDFGVKIAAALEELASPDPYGRALHEFAARAIGTLPD